MLARILQKETEETERGMEKKEKNPIKNSEILKILKFCSKHATSQGWRGDRFHSAAKKTPCAHLGARMIFFGGAFPGCLGAPFAITVSPLGAKTEEVANP
jgi:hypothetical protein